MDIDVFSSIYEVYKPKGILTTPREKTMVLFFIKDKVTKQQLSSYCLIVTLHFDPVFKIEIRSDIYSERRKYLSLLEMYVGKYHRSEKTIRMKDFCACECLHGYRPEFKEQLYERICKEILWNPRQNKAIK